MTLNRLMLPTRLPHRCEIRTGDQVATRGGKTRPNRLEHFRITGPEEVCRAVSDVYGGDPRPWDGSPTPGAWEVYTNTDVLHVAVPINMPDVIDTAWELWTGGGRVRRCDGETCETTRVEGAGDKQHAVTDRVPCMCNPEDPECKPTTRLRVVLTTIPGVGTDRLVTHSVHAAMELPGVLQFLTLSGATGLVPAYLRIRHREVKRLGVATKRFPVVTLEPQVETAALLPVGAFRDDAWQRHHAQLTPPTQAVAALEAGDPDVPVDPEPESWEANHDRLMGWLIRDHGKDAVKRVWDGKTWLDQAYYEHLNAELTAARKEPQWVGDPEDQEPVTGDVIDVHPDQESLGV